MGPLGPIYAYRWASWAHICAHVSTFATHMGIMPICSHDATYGLQAHIIATLGYKWAMKAHLEPNGGLIVPTSVLHEPIWGST